VFLPSQFRPYLHQAKKGDPGWPVAGQPELVIVNASLNRELNRSKGRHPIKQAMIKTEIKILLTRLREDRSIKGLENHAAVPHPSFSQ